MSLTQLQKADAGRSKFKTNLVHKESSRAACIQETMYQAKQAAGEVLLAASGSMKDTEGDFMLGSTPDRTQE